MSYPCGPNGLGKTHRMGGIERVEIAVDEYAWRKIKHPNPGKINFRRSDPRHPKYVYPAIIPIEYKTREALEELYPSI